MLNKHQPNDIRKRNKNICGKKHRKNENSRLVSFFMSTHFNLFLLISFSFNFFVAIVTYFSYFFFFVLILTYVVSYISSIKLLDLSNLNPSTQQSASIQEAELRSMRLLSDLAAHEIMLRCDAALLDLIPPPPPALPRLALIPAPPNRPARRPPRPEPVVEPEGADFAVEQPEVKP